MVDKKVVVKTKEAVEVKEVNGIENVEDTNVGDVVEEEVNVKEVVEVKETEAEKKKRIKAEKKAVADAKKLAEKEKLRAEMKAELMAELMAEQKEQAKDSPTEDSDTVNPIDKRAELKARRAVAKLPDERMVEVQSRVIGELILTHPISGETLQIESFGDYEYTSMKLLRHFKKKAKMVLTEPMLLILDDEAIDDLQLRKEYDKLIGTGTPEELDALFDKPMEDFVAIIKTASGVTKDTIASLAQAKFVRGELDSHTKISYIEKELNVLLVKQEN